MRTLSSDEIEEAVDLAREYLRAETWTGPVDVEALAVGFAVALVQVTSACVVGLPCEKHCGAVHGQEAEELRAGVEQILQNTSGVSDGDAAHVLDSIRKSLIFLLDRVDARDSLSFREAVEGDDEDDEAETGSSS